MYGVGNAYDAYVHNTFNHFTRGINAGGGTVSDGGESHVVITDNHIENTVSTAMGAHATYADVERNTIEHVIGAGSGFTIAGGGEAMINADTNHYTIRGNSFDDIAWYGIQSDVYDSSTTTNEPHALDDILIEDNTITSVGDSDIYAFHAKSWVITGNTLTGSIGVLGCYDLTIADNSITASTTDDSYAAIYVASNVWPGYFHRSYAMTVEIVTIEDNTISNAHPNGKGILLRADASASHVEDVTISGNSIDGALYAFLVTGSDSAAISDISIDDNDVLHANTGLNFSFGSGLALTDLTFTNNTITTPSRSGIEGGADTGATIDGLTIDSNTITDAGIFGVAIAVSSGSTATDLSITNNVFTGIGTSDNGAAIWIGLYYSSSYAPPAAYVTIENNTIHVNDSGDDGIHLITSGGTSLSHPDLYATIDDGNDFAGSPYGVYCDAGGFGSSSIHLNSDIDDPSVNVWDTGVTYHVTGP